MNDNVNKTRGPGGPGGVAAPTQSATLDFKALSQQMRGLEGDGRGPRYQIEKAKALKGIAMIVGPRAIEVGHSLNYLEARSKTFRGWINNARMMRKLFVVRTTYGDADSFASIGQQKQQAAPQAGPNTETVLLNLSQTSGTRYGVLGLVAHEFGHAAGGLEDGELGEVGPNQEATARVLAEAGLGDGGRLPYGQDLGPPGAVAQGYILLT